MGTDALNRAQHRGEALGLERCPDGVRIVHVVPTRAQPFEKLQPLLVPPTLRVLSDEAAQVDR